MDQETFDYLNVAAQDDAKPRLLISRLLLHYADLLQVTGRQLSQLSPSTNPEFAIRYAQLQTELLTYASFIDVLQTLNQKDQP